ncbi:hypothetical protein EB061_02375 [bacterium]|jgi:hypothetical protein|nr:hypothetical protein [bacterium]
MNLFLSLHAALWALLLTPFAHADAGSKIMAKVFELREERHLSSLEGSATLSRIAARAANANLDRESSIEHTDAKGKKLSTRTEEEGYRGATGEIVAVRLESCSEEERDPAFEDELGISFKEMIRASTPHYLGLTSQTGVNWTEYGYHLTFKQTTINGVCVEKFSLAIVLGRP